MSKYAPSPRYPLIALSVLATLLAGGCAVGPAYQLASTPQPAAYKETATDAEKAAAGWTAAAPADTLERLSLIHI